MDAGSSGQSDQRAGVGLRYLNRVRDGRFHPSRPALRQATIDLTTRRIDACAEMGALMTLSMGRDGCEQSFQIDHARAWADTAAARAEVADISTPLISPSNTNPTSRAPLPYARLCRNPCRAAKPHPWRASEGWQWQA